MPVALTPIPSLICEDFVFHWSYSKFIEHIDVQQFGNIKVTSTSIYLLVNFLEFIHSHLDKRDTSLALTFDDFRKAFDLVDHTFLINKDIDLGLYPDLIAWLADLLTGHQQAVLYQGLCLLVSLADLRGAPGDQEGFTVFPVENKRLLN